MKLSALPHKEIVRDISSLGGIPVFLAVIVFAYFYFAPLVAYKMFAGLVVLQLIAAAIKLLFFKHRPDGQGYRNAIEKIDAASFPSVHTLRATVLWSLVGIAANNPAIYVTSAVAIIAVAWSRIYLWKHYLRDVVAGLVLGVLIAAGILIVPL